MRVNTYVPCDLLKPLVSSYAIHEHENANEYKVIPGTSVVIGFQFKGKLSLIDDGKAQSLSASGITGLNDTFRVFRSSPNIGTVLVYFKETGASSFFKVQMHELFGESVSLENFMLRSELLILEEKLCEAKTDPERISVVEHFLISRLQSSAPDQLIANAVAAIIRSHGNIRITELADELHISQSPLEKRFRKIVGASPKKFASIVRMKHVLNGGTEALSGKSFEAGFYDQAHFIKEFKKFTGETPEKFSSGR